MRNKFLLKFLAVMLTVVTMLNCFSVFAGANSTEINEITEQSELEDNCEYGNHTFGRWLITTNETCTEPGVKIRECTICGYIESGFVSPRGHSFTEWILAQDSTCTEPGVKIRECTICGYIESGFVSPNGHSFTEWILVQDSTCTENGFKYRECPLCEYVETDLIYATGHKIYCAQENIVVDNSVTISYDIVEYCVSCNMELSRETVYLENPIKFDYSIENGEVTITKYIGSDTDVIIPAEFEGYPVTSIGNSAFSGCTRLETVTISESVTSIGVGAFSDCNSLTSVVIPDSVTTIGEGAFCYCESLTSVTIPDSVTSIGYKAFAGCDSLTSVTIPDSVTSIGSGAFLYCDNLTSVIVDKDNEYYSNDKNGVLYNKDKTVLISCPGGKEGDCTIADSTITIAEYAFFDCQKLTSVTIPGSVTNIESSAFEFCKNLTDVYYNGTEEEWNKIEINSYNDTLLNANIHFLVEESRAIIDSGKCGDNVNLTLYEDGELEITGAGDMYDYSFGLGDSYSSLVKKVNIADGVTGIGDSIFSGCTNLTSVTIPDSVTRIGNFAFYECTSLTSVTIPDSVTYIGDYAFSDCTSLISISVDSDNQYYSSDEHGVLYNKDKTTLIQYPIGNSRTTFEIPDSVESIGEGAFLNCTRLTSVTIGNSVTSIGEGAFGYCESLMSVTIPDSVTSIGFGAFAFCTSLKSVSIPDTVTTLDDLAFAYCYNLTSITVDESNEYYSNDKNGVLYNKDKTVLICCPGGKEGNYTIADGVISIVGYAFTGCKNLTSIEIPDSVTSIDSSAFFNCTSLETVTIGNGVTSIGSFAFENCTSLASVTIGNSVTSIGSGAFAYCTSLASVMIPGSVTSIGSATFHDCTSLATIAISDNVTNIGSNAFENTAYYIDVANWNGDVLYIGNHLIKAKDILSGSYKVKSGTKTIADGAFGYCDSLKSVTIPDSVISIGDGTFENCDRLTSIEIPDSVTSIGDSAFCGCDSLTSIEIPDSVLNIGIWAFSYCSSLTSITIPDSVTSIGDGALDFCTSLTSVTIGNSVTSIGEGAFGYCESLMSVTIPDSVTSIGSHVFYKCTSLTDVYYNGTEEEWNKISIGSGNENLTEAKRFHFLNGTDIEKHYVLTESIEATCTEAGYNVYECACGYSYRETTTGALGHNYEINVCTVCGSFIESVHPYENYCDETWTIYKKGAESISVTFSADTYLEKNCDYIFIYDKNNRLIDSYTDSELSDKTITVPGDTVEIRLTTDGNVTQYGFKVTKVEVNYPEGNDGIVLKSEFINTNASYGDLVTLTLDIVNNSGLSGLDFTLNYDSEKLEFVSAQQGDFSNSFDLYAINPVNSSVKGAFINIGGTMDNSCGNVATIIFRVIAEETTETTVTISSNATNDKADSLAVKTNNAVLSIKNGNETIAVEGVINSFGSEDDEILITLIKTDDSGEMLEVTDEFVYSEKGFNLSNVVAGENYVLQVSKKNHATYTYEFVADAENISLDISLHLFGDITGDGKVNTVDVAKANAQAKGISALESYDLACVDVNGDGRVNTVDVAKINAHAKGVTTLW